eukprot:5648761-Heterocapsa_arctica.AAC.1
MQGNQPTRRGEKGKGRRKYEDIAARAGETTPVVMQPAGAAALFIPTKRGNRVKANRNLT